LAEEIAISDMSDHTPGFFRDTYLLLGGDRQIPGSSAKGRDMAIPGQADNLRVIYAHIWGQTQFGGKRSLGANAVWGQTQFAGQLGFQTGVWKPVN